MIQLLIELVLFFIEEIIPIAFTVQQFFDALINWLFGNGDRASSLLGVLFQL